ncbi:prephenate dehydrogenase [Candidatus Kinetoplastibacterium desouzaii TCC079E]|uniref:Prephenate dehydrogenase n=1 Tax=Candidatus Kinetoplastidibacterium desouzai TCC079E TaxID=1208919 RepID=M1L2K1_9PROT|nr:prephenate dehydrogenase/arogenate dehydrogenase family protein [Candidatus Kinetoplastibacterium desouzaii]AGF46978.1 prephenate dehydrogenase [Candidatus Kinetoplastibacterium desouzaii TCC079E]
MLINSPGFNFHNVSVVTIVGVGLIGGSFALALKKSGYKGIIIGIDSKIDNLKMAKRLGLIDEYDSIESATKKSNLIFLSTPVSYTYDILCSIEPYLLNNTIITDVGSTKLDIVNAAYSVLGDRVSQFIPGHPIAGLEKAGPESAIPDLFNKQNVILTPLKENSKENLDIINSFWVACGANVISMSPTDHDCIFASVSHLPHFLSFMYMSYIASSDNVDLKLSLAGSGFRDFTRISAGSPGMWKDIFFANKKFINDELDGVLEMILRAKEALDKDDQETIQTILEKSSSARLAWFKE